MGGMGGAESEPDAKEIADDFEAATGVAVKDPAMFLDVMRRICACCGDEGEGESDDEPMPDTRGKSLRDVLG